MTIGQFIKNQGGKTAAAKALDISRTRLYLLLDRKHQPGRMLMANLKKNGIVYP